ncbi:MAG: hypothetical protein JWM59_638 [Verrucomicrobiales bacterium]|nr:hypothetical protein [Verrucomicrobiales bacterium]
MLRYWYFMQEAADRTGDFQAGCILGRPETITGGKKVGRLRKAFIKYLGYPLMARKSPAGAIHHILDHSWAHLVRMLPKNSPRIVTVHDLIPLRFHDGLTKAQVERYRHVIGNVRHCDAVIADSAYTKSEIQHFFGLKEELIHVVPLGVNPVALKAASAVEGRIAGIVAEARRGGGQLMVGCLGSPLGRKNLSLLAQAVERLRQRKYPVVIVKAGPPASGAAAAPFQKLQFEGGLIDLGFISDAEVGDFFGSIDALCMPSLYEGFGLPVIEAMAAGVPVVCSGVTSLPEVAGDAALLFDPHSVEALEEKLGKLFDPQIRADLGRRGLKRSADFTWDATLAKCREIYQQF